MATRHKLNQSYPVCHVVLLGRHDLTIFDRYITGNPRMRMRMINSDTSTTTRSIKTLMAYPYFTSGIIKFCIVSELNMLDTIRCNVLVINISESEPYYGSEVDITRTWTDRIRSIHCNDHAVMPVYVRYDSAKELLPDCTVRNDSIISNVTADPIRLLAKIWRIYLNVPRDSPVIYNPRPDKLANISIIIDRVDKSYTVSNILDMVMAGNNIACHRVPSNENTEYNNHIYVIGTTLGQITMKFKEDNVQHNPSKRTIYDVLLVVIGRHGMLSNRFKSYMDNICDVVGTRPVFICAMPDDNCTNPRCKIQCNEHVNTAVNAYSRKFETVDGVIQMSTCVTWNPQLVKRIIRHYVNDGRYSDTIMCSFKY